MGHDVAVVMTSWLWSFLLRAVWWPQQVEDHLLGEPLIDQIGDLGNGVARRRIQSQWRDQWQRQRMRAKWTTRDLGRPERAQ